MNFPFFRSVNNNIFLLHQLFLFAGGFILLLTAFLKLNKFYNNSTHLFHNLSVFFLFRFSILQVSNYRRMSIPLSIMESSLLVSINLHKVNSFAHQIFTHFYMPAPCCPKQTILIISIDMINVSTILKQDFCCFNLSIGSCKENRTLSDLIIGVEIIVVFLYEIRQELIFTCFGNIIKNVFKILIYFIWIGSF